MNVVLTASITYTTDLPFLGRLEKLWLRSRHATTFRRGPRNWGTWTCILLPSRFCVITSSDPNSA